MPKSLAYNLFACRGLTLIEVMISLAIFSVGILAAAAMQTNGMRSLARATQRLYNTTVACSRMELALTMGFDHVLLTTGRHEPEVLPESISVIQWEVQEDFPLPGTKHIRINVRRQGQEETAPGLFFEYVKIEDYH